MNEFLFFIQILLLVGFALGALKLGKEALICWISIQALVANLFVLKQITLFGLDVTASDSYAIGSLLGINLLQERFGQEDAKRATWICFFILFFFLVVSQLHLLYTPNSYDQSHASFQFLLSPTPRLFIASVSVFFVVQQFDLRFFSFLKRRAPLLSFATRASLSLFISQLLDTILFSFVGLYGIVASVVEIMILSFLIKTAVVISSTTLLKYLNNSFERA